MKCNGKNLYKKVQNAWHDGQVSYRGEIVIFY